MGTILRKEGWVEERSPGDFYAVVPRGDSQAITREYIHEGLVRKNMIDLKREIIRIGREKTDVLTFDQTPQFGLPFRP